jgi:sugar/nucleoside kinase (ribokinase family)
MSWDVTVAGSIHLDDVATPAGRQERQIGGSALYFSLAACPLTRVHLNAICGRDAEAELRQVVHGLPIDLTGLTVSDHPTFRWHAIQDFDRWVAETVAEESGCDPEWHPSLGPRAAAAPILFLGSMDPGLQRQVLSQSRARLIGLDSMVTFIGPQREAVLELARLADVLFLDRKELELLLPRASGWRAAGERLVGTGRLRAVVVKAGPSGAALLTHGGWLQRPAAPIDRVLDPTGAGDSVAGGFLGLCAAAERDDDAFLPEALDEGLRAAAAAISSFGTAALRTRAAASLLSQKRKL